jgi:hypothetical protein
VADVGGETLEDPVLPHLDLAASLVAGDAHDEVSRRVEVLDDHAPAIRQHRPLELRTGQAVAVGQWVPLGLLDEFTKLHRHHLRTRQYDLPSTYLCRRQARPFPRLRALNVGSCESQFGHTSRRFSRLLFDALPSTWSRTKTRGKPIHSSFEPQIAQQPNCSARRWTRM